jgi:hypothetical protein
MNSRLESLAWFVVSWIIASAVGFAWWKYRK